MQFSARFALVLATALTSKASPLFVRDMCATAPTATSGSQQPIASPTATTAAACQAMCESNASCQSFVFGVMADGSTIKCMLFAVPASQVPVQSGSLQVFDKACTSVPNTAPTTTNSGNTGTGSTGTGNTGTGSTGTGSTGTGNTGTGSTGTGNTGTGNTGTGSTGTGNTGTGQGQKDKRDVCGSAPTGPTSQAASPSSTMTNINTAADCLTQGKQTAGTQSVEFGKMTANGQDECRLFNVPVSQLPAPTEGQSLVAFDVAC